MKDKRTLLCILPVVALWLLLASASWLKPADDHSLSERRPLAQMPELAAGTLLSGDFMEEFTDYATDQFPLRETFRGIKALANKYLFFKQDSGGIYIAENHAAKMEAELDETSVNHAIAHFNNLYNTYLQEAGQIAFAIVPDKGYYLADKSGHLALDYDALYSRMASDLPWASHLDLREYLTLDSYYRTDTHWRQEQLLPVAQEICRHMGLTLPQAEEYTLTALDQPFYGVYYGQAALPMDPDQLAYLSSPVLDNCSVYHTDTDSVTQVYDLSKLTSPDLYDVFLSGGMALQQITNPAGDPDRHLIIFRDSFGSSLAPLLLRDYGTVTLIDTRYVSPGMLGNYVNFQGADVLMIYSTLILNSSGSLRK